MKLLILAGSSWDLKNPFSRYEIELQALISMIQ